MKRVLVLADLPDQAISRLATECEVDVRAQSPYEEDVLIELVAGYHGILSPLTQALGSAVFAAADRLSIVSNYAVGVDNIDLAAARKRNVVVTNTPDVLTADTADLTWALILAVVRGLSPASRLLRLGEFEGWRPKLTFGRSLHTLTLGIVGAGRIGRAVLARARGFGLECLYTSRRRMHEDRERELAAEWRPLEELIATSDIVTLHTPLTAETRHLLDEKALRSMPKGSFLINTARGPLVDEAALARVLREGHLAGAGLDVFEHEPLVDPGLLELDNVVLLPHIGSATPETRLAMANCCVDDLIRVLVRGEDPLRAVS